jgi:hypothetical protein
MNLVPRSHYLFRRYFLEEKFKEDVVPNTQTLRPAQKIKSLLDLLFLCRNQSSSYITQNIIEHFD